MALAFPVVAALAVAAMAIGVGFFRSRVSNPRPIAAPATTTTTTGESHDSRNVTYVIGDLHGDADCGHYWVDKLGLIDETTQSWTDDSASLVFLGDYVDKGPHSLPTLQLVQQLTERFPEHVTALLGNHEIELLRDRHPETTLKYLQLAFSAVHPEDYLHYIPDIQEEDRQVIDLLMNASLEVYARRLQRQMLAAPVQHARASGRYSLFEFFPEADRPYLEGKLASYQKAYLDAFASSTSLGKWLETRSIVHVENGVIFCHGGLNDALVDAIVAAGGVDEFNKLFHENADDQQFHLWLQTPAGKNVYNIAVYRGNHKPEACPRLTPMLQKLNVTKLAVGHTPGKSVRTQCGENFWALDSLLGRWIRTSGNQYCPVQGRSSQTGDFVCPPLMEGCYGQVTKFFSDGAVEIVN